MPTKTFAQFDLEAVPLTGDFIVGYKQDGTTEFRTTVEGILEKSGYQSVLSGAIQPVVGNNSATGYYSAILGGNNNTNNQAYSFIIGQGITATQPNFTYVNNLSSQGTIYDKAGNSIQWNNRPYTYQYNTSSIVPTYGTNTVPDSVITTTFIPISGSLSGSNLVAYWGFDDTSNTSISGNVFNYLLSDKGLHIGPVFLDNTSNRYDLGKDTANAILNPIINGRTVQSVNMGILSGCAQFTGDPTVVVYADIPESILTSQAAGGWNFYNSNDQAKYNLYASAFNSLRNFTTGSFSVNFWVNLSGYNTPFSYDHGLRSNYDPFMSSCFFYVYGRDVAFNVIENYWGVTSSGQSCFTASVQTPNNNLYFAHLSGQGSTIPLNQWVQVTLVRQISSSKLDVYYNGIKDHTFDNTQAIKSAGFPNHFNIIADTFSAKGIRIGSRPSSVGNVWGDDPNYVSKALSAIAATALVPYGLVDEYSIWNKALTPFEINTLDNSGEALAYPLNYTTLSAVSSEQYTNLNNFILGGTNNSVISGSDNFILGTDISTAGNNTVFVNNLKSLGLIGDSNGNSNQWNQSYNTITSLSSIWNSKPYTYLNTASSIVPVNGTNAVPSQVVTTTTTTTTGTVVDGSLQAYWSLNDSRWINSNNGSLSLSGNATVGTGILSGCAYFDGTTQLYNNSVFNFAGDFSISLWFNAAHFALYSPLITNTTNSGIELGIAEYGNAITLGSPNGVYNVLCQYNFNTSQWYHIVLTRVSGSYSCWINGTVQTVSYSDNNNYSCGIALGKNTFTYFNYRGSIDEVGIWNRSLTNFEIGVLYNSGSALSYPLQYTTYTTNTSASNPYGYNNYILGGTNNSILTGSNNYILGTNIAVASANNTVFTNNLYVNGNATITGNLSLLSNSGSFVQSITAASNSFGIIKNIVTLPVSAYAGLGSYDPYTIYILL